MRFLRTTLLIACGTAFVVIGISCSGNTRVAGWGSETTNGVTASISKSDGSPAVGATVRLRTSGYVTQPPASLTKSAIDRADTLTDEQGRFEITGIDPGAYSIEVVGPTTNSGQAGAVLFTCSLAANDTVDLQTDTLRPCAAAYGAIDTSGMSGKRVFVQVLGLERLVPVDSAGAFELNDLPAGLFSLHIIAVEGTQTTVVRTDQVSAVSGDTVPVTMTGWNFSKKAYLNSTPAGAGVSGSVFNFPVLIRLTNSNFDFSQAKGDGGDIRFSKADNAPLPYEIERWDAALKQAEIWVKVDTVHGNNSTQSVTMYWGNPNATGVSNSAAVFDTSDRFQGVWHLNEPDHAMAKDATGNHFDGTPSDTAPAATDGMLGAAKQFDGTSAFFTMKNTASGRLDFPEHAVYAVSAWVYADTLDSTYQKIIEKNNFQYKLQIDCFDAWSFGEYESSIGHELTNYPATARTWLHIVGTRSGSGQSLFINGILVNSTITKLAFSGPRDTASDVTIGRGAADFTGSWFFFKGKIDEARIENTARSTDWIRLCFMNQKAQDALVVFK